MNIAGVMAAWRLSSSDHMAKAATAAVASFAGRYTLTVEAPTEELADYLSVHLTTARRALARAVQYGWLSVDKPEGNRPTWRLLLVRSARGTPSGALGVDPACQLAWNLEKGWSGPPAPAAGPPLWENLRRDARGYLYAERAAACGEARPDHSARIAARELGSDAIGPGDV